MAASAEAPASLGQSSARRRRGSWRRRPAAALAPAAPVGCPTRPSAAFPAVVQSADPLLAELEEVLVAELRLAQAIDSLAGQERFALEADSPGALAEAARAKLACLGELARLETRRDGVLAAWARQAGRPDETAFEQVVRRLDPATGQRLGWYQLGVEAHLEHCRALGPANRALAHAAVARQADWRHDLLRPAAGGGSGPPEPAGQPSARALLAERLLPP